jgi:DNA invertase Pin-like site-specific DNA recombinase
VIVGLTAVGLAAIGLALFMMGRSPSVSLRGRKRARYGSPYTQRRAPSKAGLEQLREIRPEASKTAQGVRRLELAPRATSAREPKPGANRRVSEPGNVTALGYVRSTNGAGRLDYPELHVQAEQLERLCKGRGWTLAELVRESNVNGSGQQPALDYALERLRRGEASCLVVSRLEWLCRSVGELGGILERLNEVDARLVCLEPELDTATEAGAVAAQALVAVSAWESEQLSQRTRKGLAAARAKGVTTRPAVGDRPQLKHRILALREEGLTLQAIADVLNDEDVPTLRGGSLWRPSSVQAAVGYKRPVSRRPPQQQSAAHTGGRSHQPQTDDERAVS